jgi:hypothetical protein
MDLIGELPYTVGDHPLTWYWPLPKTEREIDSGSRRDIPVTHSAEPSKYKELVVRFASDQIR